MGQDEEAAGRVGRIRIRKHCTFTWREPDDGERRTVVVGPGHCAPCIAELRELGFLLVREEEAGG